MSARLEAIQARRAAEFLDVCAELEDRLEAAKQKVHQAREAGDEAALKAAKADLRPVAEEMHEFRRWARTMGRPREGMPGRDAVIRAGV
ncbi:hypothetical protein [Nonomuraea sp. NPDC003804]|uniref:hypothetical protein n=1 Tax=Nonomuraea sp. NPDC003804 TaxID=3154547 RepID=UPI00339E0021